MATAELLVAIEQVGSYAPGDIIAAKRPGSPWGRRELRPAKGQKRSLAIVESDDEELAAKVAKGVAVEPFADEKQRSAKRIDVQKLSTAVKEKLADPKQTGKVGRVDLVAKTKVSDLEPIKKRSKS